jgi:Transcription elongation factor
MDKEPITVIGLNKLQKELEEIKNFKRPKVIEAIAEARGHGD